MTLAEIRAETEALRHLTAYRLELAAHARACAERDRQETQRLYAQQRDPERIGLRIALAAGSQWSATERAPAIGRDRIAQIEM